MANVTMDKLVALAKNRGFVYPGSEIYGGLSNSWDYGPLGVAMKTISSKLGGKIRRRKPLQRRSRQRNHYEPHHLASKRTYRRFFRSSYGLQSVQISPPRRRSH